MGLCSQSSSPTILEYSRTSGKLGHFFSSKPEISVQTDTFKMGGHEGFSDLIVTHLVEDTMVQEARPSQHVFLRLSGLYGH
jgi:hypothetical protein